MSELKPYIGPHPTDATLTEYYLKSEVDDVIANRDYEIAELKKSIGKLLKSNMEQVMDEVLQRCLIYGEGFVPVEHAMRLVADIHHQKYKRCLDKAEMCTEKAKRYYYLICLDGGNSPKYKRFPEKMDFWEKWRNRWLKLAEKFKEAK